jgi:hypothetical protein
LSLARKPTSENNEEYEISPRIRELQTQLNEQIIINGARKARIAELIEAQPPVSGIHHHP